MDSCSFFFLLIPLQEEIKIVSNYTSTNTRNKTTLNSVKSTSVWWTPLEPHGKDSVHSTSHSDWLYTNHAHSSLPSSAFYFPDANCGRSSLPYLSICKSHALSQPPTGCTHQTTVILLTNDNSGSFCYSCNLLPLCLSTRKHCNHTSALFRLHITFKCRVS